MTEVSINIGSSMAALLIPVVGTFIIVTTRQMVTALVVLPFYRPKRRTLTWTALWPALALGVVLALMNLTYYEAIGRLGLGIAATLEFLGPLTLALAASRRILDVFCAIAALGGVMLLTGLDGEIDALGVVFALIAAACWAAYILLTRRVATQLPGLDGLSIATLTGLVLLIPPALVIVDWSVFSWPVIGLLLAGGLLSSALPYSLDTFILRRITPRLYAIITSCAPAIAALVGLIVLGEQLGVWQLVGIVAVCVAAATAIATQKDGPAPDPSTSPHTIA